MPRLTLTDAKVKAAKPSAAKYELSDAKVPGLSLRVGIGGSKTWAVRYRDPRGDRTPSGDRKKHRLVLGRYPQTKLADARKMAKAVLHRVDAGENPKRAKLAAVAGRVSVANAVEDWLSAAGLRPRTESTYRQAAARFVAWCSEHDVPAIQDLTREDLAAYRRHVVKLPRRGSKKAKRAPSSINRELRTIAVFVNRCRKDGRTPQLDRDAIADTLEAMRVEHTQPDFLKPAKVRKLLRAAAKHDAATFSETRREHAGEAPKGSTPKHPPIAPFATFVLLTGMRANEALSVAWDDVDLKAGTIRVRARDAKTRRDRTVSLEVSPMLRTMLTHMKLRSDGERVFEGLTYDMTRKANMRLVESYGAPEFTWQWLRATCATTLVNAPGIFASAAVYRESRQLGHSTAVAERHYCGLLAGLPRDAETIEDALGIADDLEPIVAAIEALAPVSRIGAVS